MAIDVSFRDGYSTSAQDLSRFNKNFLINEGVANDGLKVSQSAVPAMSVQVIAGTSYFYGTGTTADTMFEFYSDSTETVTIPTASAQARIDIVCCKVDASTGVASLVVVSGTPSGSPAVPATPASHYKLANVAVGAGVTTITNANITDTRRTMFMVPTGARNQGLINGYIIPSVASNNLTLAVSTSPTSVVAPTPTNPVFVWIGGVLRPITSALSVSTLTAGTNYFNAGSAELATREIDYFVYVGDNAGTIFLGISRLPYGRTLADFNLVSSTSERAFWGASGTTSPVVNVGRFAATLSASPSFNWSVPTFTNSNLIQEPIYETRFLDWAPTYSGSGGMTVALTADNRNRRKYTIKNDMLWIEHSAILTTGGTAGVFITMTLPFTIGTSANQGGRSTFTVANTSNVIGKGSGADTGPANTLEVSRYDGLNQALGNLWQQVSGWANLR